MSQSHIRNFAIIAHIDHGKSTLADRLLELTGTVKKRDMQAQILDSNPIERERGITIKLAPVRMRWGKKLVNGKQKIVIENGKQKMEQKDTPISDFQSPLPVSDFQQPFSNPQPFNNQGLTINGQQSDSASYVLNLIDTPGHVDFSYEVSRSLAACEGAILVVDSTQGVQAQTLAHLSQARQHNLSIIPVLNKIDMPIARIEETEKEIYDLGFKKDEIIRISAKTGQNVEQVLEAIINRIPPPQGDSDSVLRALVFSSQYDPHKGVVVFVRLVDGNINYQLLINNYQLLFMASGAEVTPIEVGYFNPKMRPSSGLSTGEVGYIATGLKDIRLAKVGDTITQIQNAKFKMQNDKSKVKSDKGNQKIVDGKQKMVMENRKQKLEKSNLPISNFHNQFLPGQAGPFSEHPISDLGVKALPGYKEPKPMVFLGLFPLLADEFGLTREAMEKLRLSDSAFTFRPMSSQALGNGFQCGFLGLLHAEIVQERIQREFGLTMIATIPSVEYQITLKSGVKPEKLRFKSIERQKLVNGNQNLVIENGKEKIEDKSLPISDFRSPLPVSNFQLPVSIITIQSASEFPDPSFIDEVKEPIMQVKIYSPKKYVGAIMQLSQEKRGQYIDLNYQADNAVFTYLVPLSEMIIDFFDRLKSISEGYASLDYEFFDYETADVVKVDILLNHEKVDALSFLVVRDQAERRGKDMVEKLATVIPRHQFSIPVQGALGGTIISRADIKPFRKDVTQKLYGGDRSRKDKLLDKQKKGKERMKTVGRVQIPQNAFFEVLKRS